MRVNDDQSLIFLGELSSDTAMKSETKQTAKNNNLSEFHSTKLCSYHIWKLFSDSEDKCLLTQFTQTRKRGIKRLQKREGKSEREKFPSSESGRAAVMTSEQINYMASKEKSSSLHN